MNRDDIIRMAKAIGIQLPEGPFPERGSFTLPQLLGLADLAYEAGAAAEREACAKVCEESNAFDWPECAAAIRARGNK